MADVGVRLLVDLCQCGRPAAVRHRWHIASCTGEMHATGQVLCPSCVEEVGGKPRDNEQRVAINLLARRQRTQAIRTTISKSRPARRPLRPVRKVQERPSVQDEKSLQPLYVNVSADRMDATDDESALTPVTISTEQTLQPTAFFFDNDARNFLGCEQHIVQIKVDETPMTATTCQREPALDRAAYGINLFGDMTPEASVLRQMSEALIGRMQDYTVYYDPRSGITAPQFDAAIAAMQRHDFVFLDFDRAVSVFEGFLFAVPTWERILEGTRHHFRVGTDITVDDLIRAHLGGRERAAMVAHSLKRIFDKCGASHVYVVTNNTGVHLIRAVMEWLTVEGECNEPFAQHHVVSTHFTGLRSKAEVIHTILEQSACGDLPGTLTRWSPADSSEDGM